MAWRGGAWHWRGVRGRLEITSQAVLIEGGVTTAKPSFAPGTYAMASASSGFHDIDRVMTLRVTQAQTTLQCLIGGRLGMPLVLCGNGGGSGVLVGVSSEIKLGVWLALRVNSTLFRNATSGQVLVVLVMPGASVQLESGAAECDGGASTGEPVTFFLAGQPVASRVVDGFARLQLFRLQSGWEGY